MSHHFLKELLLQEELISSQKWSQIVKSKDINHKDLIDKILDVIHLEESTLLKLIAKHLHLEYIDDIMSLYQEEVNSILSDELAKLLEVIPIYMIEDSLYFATSSLNFLNIKEDITMATGLDARPILTSRKEIEKQLNKLYSYQLGTNKDQVDSTEDKELLERVASAPVVKMVHEIISHAYRINASDIHINPEEDFTLIRLRVDGKLLEHTKIAKESHDAMIARIKILANMNIAERRLPQDGAFKISEKEMTVDIRVASIPTLIGEKMVLRLLGGRQAIEYNLDSLQINDDAKNTLKKIMKIPNGIILITGPTGSGKTTTLYSLLNELSVNESSIVTIEDPIEKEFPGITQVQTNQKAGLTFSKGLRSILRLDPDVIMVGEIRDKETAQIAIRSAITGHLVLSTLHTNDALSAIPRLIDMGIENYLVSSAVKCLIAQRLLAKNCVHCRKEMQLSEQTKKILGIDQMGSYLVGMGCDKCDRTGYKGRVAIFEIIPVSEKMQDAISQGSTYKQLKELIEPEDRNFLKDDLIRHIKGGDISLQEANKVLFNNDVF